MDELDKNLLEALQKDGKRSYTELAEVFETTVGTVSNRVQRLMDQGILRIVGVVNPIKTGNSFMGIFGVKVKIEKLQSVIDQLSAIEEVRYIAATIGTYDLIVEIITSSNVEFYRILREEFSNIDGIERMESSIILNVYKQTYDFGVRLK